MWFPPINLYSLPKQLRDYENIMENNTEEPVKRIRIKPERPVTPYEQERINWYIDNNVPDKHKIATRRALMGQVARSVAIKINCLQCCNYEIKAVALCEIITCAIYPVRPYQHKIKDLDLIDDNESDEVDDDDE